MEVIIVGAGIGGLTLALTLHRAGIPARVFEAATELRPIGAGINVLPHASKELCALGLESDAVPRRASRPGKRSSTIGSGNSSTASRLAARPAMRRRNSRYIAAICSACCWRVRASGSARTASTWAGSASRFQAGRPWHHRPLRRCRDRRRASAATRRRCGRLRRPAFGHPQAAASARRRAALLRRQHVARRHAVGAVSFGRQHGARGLADPRQDGDLSDPQQHRRGGPPARQLGRRNRNAEASRQARLEPPGKRSRTSSMPTRTGTSIGWMCRR